jgi:hypothetical protein
MCCPYCGDKRTEVFKTMYRRSKTYRYRAASSARRDSGRKRRRYAGKAWTGSGLAKAQRARVGKVIESRHFEEDAKWSFAK